MVKLKELLKFNNAIKIVVEDEDFVVFLNYMKQEGCIWRSGSVIKPRKDKPSNYTKAIVVTSDYLIYQPYGWISMMALQSKPEYLFKNILKDKIVDELVEKSLRTQKYDKEYQLAVEANKLAFKRKCDENREISKLQIKYQNIANSLQKQFFVRFDNDDELLKLILLFKRCGYENTFGIDLVNFNKDPKIICVDNENMTFQPASLNCCACGLIAKKKIYKTSVFEEMMIDIFKIG